MNILIFTFLCMFLTATVEAFSVGAISLLTQSSVFDQLELDDQFGRSVLSLGDFNGDGNTDIAVGAPFDDDGGTDRGAVYILFLNQNETIQNFQKISNLEGNFFADLRNNHQFGHALTSLEDFNGDGTIDIAVGTPSDDDGGANRGAVYILFLNPDATVMNFQKISDIAGNFEAVLENNDRFGDSVASLGDFNGDNTTDIVVGTPSDDDGGLNRGAVYILFLNPDGTVINFQKISDTAGNFNDQLADNDRLGNSVACIQDLNGDNTPDIVVGASQTDGDISGNDRGAVYILFLNPDATVSSFQRISETQGNITFSLEPDDQFGSSVASLGDFNGDGTTDIAVGAALDDDGGTDRGAVYILLLNSGGFVQDFEIISDELDRISFADGDQFGTSVSFDPLTTSLFVGSPLRDGPLLLNEGVVYAFGFDCGDGIVGRQEQCDDGNLVSGDGCSAVCQFELGFDCQASLSMSVCRPICGDGLIVFGEECDDENLNSNDGCSQSCELEEGFNCQICETICGDGIIAGNEECDDENVQSGDGCSSTCSSESNALSPPVIGGVVAGSVIFLCVVILILFAIGCFTLSKIKNKKEAFDFSFVGDHIPILSDIQIGKVLGSGAFGDVYQAKWNNIDVALKAAKGEDIQEFQNELQIMVEMRHPNILQLFGLFIKSEDEPMIVIEFMNRGDLLHLLQTEADISNNQLVEFCQQVSLGMEYLHCKNILHRDLACRNILVSSKSVEDNSNLIVKVADFGLSRQIDDYYTTKSKKIPIRWTAPEVIEFSKVGKPSDVWSFSIVIWEIFSRGAIPYAGYSNQQVVKLVKNGTRLIPPHGMDSEISALMTECWQIEPKDRPQFPEISKQLQMVDLTTSSQSAPQPPNPLRLGEANYNNVNAPLYQEVNNPQDHRTVFLEEQVKRLEERNKQLEQENQKLKAEKFYN